MDIAILVCVAFFGLVGLFKLYDLHVDARKDHQAVMDHITVVRERIDKLEHDEAVRWKRAEAK